MCTTEFAMLPIHNSEMSSEAINRMHLKNIYSASVFVDNLGNVIVASGSKTIIIDLSLEHVFEMDTDIQGTHVQFCPQLSINKTSFGSERKMKTCIS